MPPSLSAGPIARGSLFSIFGVRFGPGATVRIGGLEARPVAVSAERIDAILPRAAPPGPARLTVTWRGQTSQPFALTVAGSSPGIFTQNGQGWGPAAGLARRVFRPGDTVTLDATGLGPARAADLEVIAGGRAAPVTEARPAATPGHDRIRFRIPRDAPFGCSVPVQVLAKPSAWSNAASIAIAPDGRDCRDPGGNWFVKALESGGRRAIVLLLRSRIQLQLGPGPPAEIWGDYLATLFGDWKSRTGAISRLRMLPPAGACVSFAGTTSPARIQSAFARLGDSLGGRRLGAGPRLKLDGPNGERAIGKAPMGWQSYHEQLGGRTFTLSRPVPPYLAPGDYAVEGGGGADVAPFRVRLRVPAEVAWTNQDEIAAVDRARGVTLRWTGIAPRDQAAILAVNLDQENGATGVCLCLAQPGATALSIPPAALANFPASPAERAIPTSFLALITMSAAQPFAAKGLDAGDAGWMFVRAKSVPFR